MLLLSYLYCHLLDFELSFESMKPQRRYETTCLFLGPKEVAIMLGVNVNTVYHFAKIPEAKGGPPVRRFGNNLIRFPREQFLLWAHNTGSKNPGRIRPD